MLKKIMAVTLVVTSAFALTGCDLDDSYTVTKGPVYTTTNQQPATVTPGNHSMGYPGAVSASSNAAPVVSTTAVTTSNQPTRVVTVADRTGGPSPYQQMPVVTTTQVTTGFNN